MSKLLRYAAAGVAMASLGIASGAQAATTDTADVTAEILTALSVDIDATADTLDFGTIADGGITGNQTIVVDTTGTRGACPANLICGGTTAAPLFHVTGLAAKAVDISFANATETLSYDTVANGGPAPAGFTSAMQVGTFVTDAASNQVTLDGTGAADFSVGGTLTVQPNMAPGIYSGTLTVSVAYN
jgi:spore coat protein U-like protein